MPEEQAFSVLVKIMYEYGLRALYKNNFEELHCKFYQLERLLQVQMASRWLLNKAKCEMTASTNVEHHLPNAITVQVPTCTITKCNNCSDAYLIRWAPCGELFLFSLPSAIPSPPLSPRVLELINTSSVCETNSYSFFLTYMVEIFRSQ